MFFVAVVVAVLDSAFLVNAGVCLTPQRTNMTYILHWHTDLECATTAWQQQQLDSNL